MLHHAWHKPTNLGDRSFMSILMSFLIVTVTTYLQLHIYKYAKSDSKYGESKINCNSNGGLLDLFPLSRFIFISSWQRPAKIMRAWSDGSRLTPIVNTTLGLPNGLAIDWR